MTEGLERLARGAGMSLNAYAVRELSEIARRANNPELLGALPSFEVAVDEVVGDLESGRKGR